MTIGISLLFTFSCTWCLYNLLLGETFEVPCEAEWTLSPYSGTCLKLFHEKGSWKRAKDFCQSQNAALLKVIDSKMNNYVLNILPGQDPYYIGLILDDEKRKLVWLNEDEEAGYAAFERRKTMLIKGTMCGVVSKQQGRVDLLWDVVDCASPQQFLCLKRPSNGTCSTGWTLVKDDYDEDNDNKEYCFDFEKSNQMLSWEDARQSCKQKNGDLAKIYTYSLDRLIHDFLSQNEGQPFYIGLKVNNTEPRWLDEQESAENYYLNFELGQINKGGSLCGQLNNQSLPTGEWALVNCESSHKFICEIDKGLCPYGWIPSASSGTCIKIYHHTPVTESQAVERCQQDGANLVTILNEQMSQFITDQVSWDVGFMHLLGLNDKRGIDQYRWLDFIEPINFTKWDTSPLYPPEPNDPESVYKCAFIMLQEFYEPGYWAVSRCEYLAKTICEKFADCSKESYGMLCPKECQHCKESPLSPPCNPRFGLCYYGSAECPLGTYGPNCGNRCNVSCGGADNACSVADGSCLNGCDTGYAGKSCDERAREKTQSASSSTFPVWIVIVIPCVTMLIVTV